MADVFANALMRKRTDEALRESEERLGLATESSGTGLWSMQIATRRVWASAKLREIFSFGPEEDLTEESFARQTHPEDRERVQAATRHAVETGEKLSVEYRIVLPDGKQRWISSSGRLQSGPAGTPERLMGASLDITERKANEQALVKSYAEIKQLKDQLQAESDYLRAEIKVSHAHGEILGRSPGMRRVLHQVA